MVVNKVLVESFSVVVVAVVAALVTPFSFDARVSASTDVPPLQIENLLTLTLTVISQSGNKINPQYSYRSPTTKGQTKKTRRLTARRRRVFLAAERKSR